MGRISEIASMQLDKVAEGEYFKQYSQANAGQSGTIPMAEDYKKKKDKRNCTKSIGSDDSGIHDDENDWLSRQLKEEDEALKRMEEEYGLKHFSSDAQKLKAEHAIEHAMERSSGIRR